MKTTVAIACMMMILGPLGVAEACGDEPIVTVSATVSAEISNRTDGCLQVHFYPPPPDVDYVCD